MEFEQQAQEDLYVRVGAYLAQGFGELAEPVPDDPAFRLVLGGHSRLLVSVHANGPERASVMVYTILADGLLITAEVATFLLHRNHEIAFGTLELQDDDSIVFRHMLFAEAVTKENLTMLVRMMAADAEELEDELNMRYR